MNTGLLSLHRTATSIGLFTLPLIVASCSGKKSDPTPPIPKEIIYSVRYSATFSPSTTASPGVDIDAEEFQVLGTSGREGYDFIGNGVSVPVTTPVQRILSPQLKGKKARLTVYFDSPTYRSPIKQGDGITAELLGDNTVLASVSMDYTEARAIGPKETRPGSEFITKTVEVTIP